MTFDLSNVWSILITIATPVAIYFAASLAKTIESRLKIQSGSTAADDLDQALMHGVDIGLQLLKDLAVKDSHVVIPPGTLSNVVSLVIKLAPAAVKSLGITEEEVEKILIAKISKTMGDTSVTTPPKS